MCDCSLCALNADLSAEVLDRERLSAGVDWLVEHAAEREMYFAYLIGVVAEYTKAHDAPELVEALRVLSPKHAGVHHPDYVPPERLRIVYAPRFVESYADLTGRTIKETRAALRESGSGGFHLTATDV